MDKGGDNMNNSQSKYISRDQLLIEQLDKLEKEDKLTTVYKVVSRGWDANTKKYIDKSLSSYCRYEDSAVPYALNEWTFPKENIGGPLMAFNNITNALQFWMPIFNEKSGRRFSLYKALAWNATNIVHLPLGYKITYHHNSLIWLDRNTLHKELTSDKVDAPIGTLFCDGIKLVEFIQ